MAVTLWLSYGVRDTEYIPYLGRRYLFLVFAFGFVAWSELFGIRFCAGRHDLVAVGVALNVVSLGLILIPTAIRVAGYSVSAPRGFAQGFSIALPMIR